MKFTSIQFTKEKFQELTLAAFISVFEIIFEKHPPLKKKYLRTNHSKFVTK